MVSAWIWVLAFTLETASVSFELKMLFIKVEFIGITLLPVAWLVLIRSFTGQPVSPTKIAYLLLIPILTNIILWSNSYHNWFMGSPYLTTINTPFPVVVLDYQFWFFGIHAPYGYALILYSIIRLINAIPKLDHFYRYQARLLLLAILLPVITDILYVLGISPVKHYNYTTAVFSISGLILFWALFRFRFLDLLPIARDTIISSLHDGVIILNHNDRIVEVNHKAATILSLESTVIGKQLDEIHHPITKKILTAYKEGLHKNDIHLREPQECYYDLRINPVKNNDKATIGHIIMLRDITERMRLFNEVQILAIHDSLTNIYNRRYFLDLCNREIIRTRRTPENPISLLMIDLDDFKSINDRYGHTIGDKALVIFSNLIQSQLRGFDIFGRIGGEEFAILLTDTNREEAYQIAERLRSSIEELSIRDTKSNDFHITASFGVISSEQLAMNEMEITSMIDLADHALYHAKNKGRNQVVVLAR